MSEADYMDDCDMVDLYDYQHPCDDDGMCESCGVNPADPQSGLCVQCDTLDWG